MLLKLGGLIVVNKTNKHYEYLAKTKLDRFCFSNISLPHEIAITQCFFVVTIIGDIYLGLF